MGLNSDKTSKVFCINMWIWLASKFAKFHAKRLNRNENIPKSICHTEAGYLFIAAAVAHFCVPSRALCILNASLLQTLTDVNYLFFLFMLVYFCLICCIFVLPYFRWNKVVYYCTLTSWFTQRLPPHLQYVATLPCKSGKSKKILPDFHVERINFGKKFWKSVHMCHSYYETSRGFIFWDTVYNDILVFSHQIGYWTTTKMYKIV